MIRGCLDQSLPWKTQYWEDKRLDLLWQSGFKFFQFLLIKGTEESCKTWNWIINLGRKKQSIKKDRGSPGVYFLSIAEVKEHIPSPTHPVLIAINSSYVEASHFLGLCV